ncbi:MAG: SDR family NAD(P)-dependent oxidoreductase, partial [Bacteroidota bacterium]|nr:SDR family NAD(P)-dependent oxidoreductase [Bacteroidota bacterium]
KNKIILLTGATDGIGKQAAFELAEKKAILLMHGKNIEKGLKIKDEIILKTGNKNVEYFNADFTSFDDIKQFSENIHNKFSHIDILINNAGIYESQKVILKNGIEKNFMVNHLAMFSLTLELLNLLKKAENARIINVSSMIHANNIDFDNLNGEKHYSGSNAYSLTKLCNILFTVELSSILKNENITVNAMHPGVINTKLLKVGWGAMGSSTSEGAERILYLANSDDVKNSTGKYFMNDRITKPANICDDKNVRRVLWEISSEYLAKHNF